MRFFKIAVLTMVFYASAGSRNTYAQADTVKVMAYNVLNYGVYCQGPNSTYHNYLKTVVQYANPDIISLEKMGSIPMYAGDIHGVLPIGFGDSILDFALNAAFPGRYAYCPFSNYAGANNMCMLFYNQNKFGCVGVTFMYSSTTDFDCYKLYYKDPNLATTHDTTFLYVIPNHDISGNSNEADRGLQIAGYMQQVQNHFTHLPNMITMGDFNVRYTTEPLYQTLTAPADTNYRFFDPPFYPDNHLTAPADWDSNPAGYTNYLTTSTRASSTAPNSCGTSGGAKNWYDHMFISPWITRNANYIKYIPNSYTTLGNDGHRLSVSVNDNTTVTNTSAPAGVIEAIYQMSNKYPVMISLAITPNTTGISPTDPELTTGVAGLQNQEGKVNVVNPVENELVIRLANCLTGKPIHVAVMDVLGQLQIKNSYQSATGIIRVPCDLKPGIYYLRLTTNGQIIYQGGILKK